MLKPEILAPVGNSEMLTAAVRSGADAVYLGAKDFSARRNAENFSKLELKNAIAYCHIRGVRVYLALNILIKDSEMENAFDLAKYAYENGIDGIIVEDLGLAKILNECIPELKLHASTQMSVHSPSALIELKKLGFCQVVAAREMSKSELKALCEKATELDITVEVFVHGALCMSMSGQCLLSAFLGSRSGNRGLCAGPCRLPFSAERGTGYDLSLKDLSLIDYISELCDMGVGSFKIEGRMKRPEYVAAAVSACRQAVDNGFADESIKEILKNVFSRSGFTDGYYKNTFGKDMFGIRTKDDVLSGGKAFPVLHEIYRNERQSNGLEMEFSAKAKKPIMLKIKSGLNEATIFGEIPQNAKNKSATKDDIENSLLKLGGTPYFAQSIKVDLDDGLFIPQSIINSLRRDAVEKLNQIIENQYLRSSGAEFMPISKKPEFKQPSNTLVVRFENAEQIPENIENLGISACVYPIEQNPDLIPQMNIPKIADIPAAVISEKKLEERLKLFKAKGFCAAFCNNLAQISICKRVGLKALGGTGLNIANSFSLNTADSLGIKAVILSNEVTENEMSEINSPINYGVTVYGNIPLMVFKNCPLKNGTDCSKCDKNGYITDRMGVKFPVRCRMGYSELLNSCPIWIGDKWNKNSKADFGVLYFTNETKERAKEVITLVKEGKPADCKHTKGLFFRGVI